MTDCSGPARWTRNDLLPVAALLLLSSAAFSHLLALPVFADEAGQIRWVFRVIEAGEWLQPLSDGKPLEAWPLVPLVRLGFHPLSAARALHVMAGMIGVVLIYRLALHLSGRGTALVCGVLFAVCPFTVYLQRLALSDMFLCAAGIGVLLSVIRFIESPAWPQTWVLAAALVLAALCKLPVGFIFLMSMPLALAFMPAPQRRRLLGTPERKLLLAAHAPAALLALGVLAAAGIRLQRGQLPGFGLQDLIGIGMGGYQDIPGAMGVPRPRLIGELTAQLSWPVTVLGSMGLVSTALLDGWRQRWLLAVGALPMLAIGLLADFWFSRYLLFTLPPLLICAVCGWRSLSLRAAALRRPIRFGTLAICAGFMGRQSALLIFDPAAAHWSPADRYQYFEAPGSGFGYPEAARYVLRSAQPPAMIYALDGHSAYQLLAYLPPDWHARVKSIFYASDGAVLRTGKERLENLFARTPAWVIAPDQLWAGDLRTNVGESGAAQIQMHPVAEFDKPGSLARLGLYAVARQ